MAVRNANSGRREAGGGRRVVKGRTALTPRDESRQKKKCASFQFLSIS